MVSWDTGRKPEQSVPEIIRDRTEAIACDDGKTVAESVPSETVSRQRTESTLELRWAEEKIAVS